LPVTQLVSTQTRQLLYYIADDFPAIYNATAAFCEGLHGEVTPRGSRAEVDYEVIDAEAEKNTSLSAKNLFDALTTSQARAYWSWCDGSLLFPIATLIRKWLDARRTPTRWQTVFFPQAILDGWRNDAQDAGVKVSTYDLFTSWLHMVSENHCVALDFQPVLPDFVLQKKKNTCPWSARVLTPATES
jgi:hypothetical protein